MADSGSCKALDISKMEGEGDGEGANETVVEKTSNWSTRWCLSAKIVPGKDSSIVSGSDSTLTTFSAQAISSGVTRDSGISLSSKELSLPHLEMTSYIPVR